MAVADWQVDRRVEGRGKRKVKLIITQVKKGIFHEGDVWEEKSE